MKTAVWIPLLAVTALLSAACSTAFAPAASATTPTSTAASGQPHPGQCLALSNLCLALVTLRGGSSYIVRDITDINHPTTVSSLGAIIAPAFVSVTDISFGDDSGLVRAPLAGSPKSLVATQGGAIFTWSPAGNSVVYAALATAETATVHQQSAGGDRVLGSLPTGGAGGCETIAGCAIANTLDFRLSYSPDGTAVSLVSSAFGGSVFRIWSSDGKVLKSSDGQGATMSAWSGDGLYFRDAQGVEVWRKGAVSSFLPGVAWIKPKASPAGGQIVYATRDSGGWAHTYIVDTTTQKVRELKNARTGPVFLTSRYIWYQGERACVPADACGSQPPFHPLSGKTYVYDLQDGTETVSLITSVVDVWPHAA